MKWSAIILVFVVFLLGCKKDDEIQPLPEDEVKNVFINYDSDLYYFSELNKDPKRLTFSPNQPKEQIEVSPDLQQLAYLSEDVVYVINLNGELVEEISDYNNVTDFGWSQDSETLFIIDGNINFHGPAFNTDLITPPTSMPSQGGWTLRTLDFSSNGDVAYSGSWSYGYLNPMLTYEYGSAFIRKSHDGLEEYSDESQNPNVYNDVHVSFVGNGSGHIRSNRVYSDLEESDYFETPDYGQWFYNPSIEKFFGFKQNPSDPVKYIPTVTNKSGVELRNLPAYSVNGSNAVSAWMY